MKKIETKYGARAYVNRGLPIGDGPTVTLSITPASGPGSAINLNKQEYHALLEIMLDMDESVFGGYHPNAGRRAGFKDPPIPVPFAEERRSMEEVSDVANIPPVQTD